MDIWTDKKISPAGSVNKEDVKKWLKNFAMFGAPLVLIFLMQVQAGRSLQESLPVLYGALIQALIDLVRKFMDGNK